jgi:hypothetical protein
MKEANQTLPKKVIKQQIKEAKELEELERLEQEFVQELLAQEERLEKARQKYAENKERERERCRQTYLANKEKRIAKIKEYHETDYYKAWRYDYNRREETKKFNREYQRAWRAKQKAKCASESNNIHSNQSDSHTECP